MLQQAIHNELRSDDEFGNPPCVVSLVTQTVVDATDRAWTTPGSKAIGAWMTAAEVGEVRETGDTTPAPAQITPGLWRRVVPSPRPLEVVEMAAIRTLVGVWVTYLARVDACRGLGAPSRSVLAGV